MLPSQINIESSCRVTEAIDIPEVISEVALALDSRLDNNDSLQTNYIVISEDITDEVNIRNTLLTEEITANELPEVITIDENNKDITDNINTDNIKIKVPSLNFDDYLNNKNNPKHQMKITCFNANGLKKEINNRSYKVIFEKIQLF